MWRCARIHCRDAVDVVPAGGGARILGPDAALLSFLLGAVLGLSVGLPCMSDVLGRHVGLIGRGMVRGHRGAACALRWSCVDLLTINIGVLPCAALRGTVRCGRLGVPLPVYRVVGT